MVQLHNFFFFITSMAVPRGMAASVPLKWFVNRGVPTGASSSNGTIIPIPIPLFPFLVYLHLRKFIRSMDRAKSGGLVKASRPILLPDKMERSSSTRNALFHFVPILHFLIIKSMADLSAKRERALRSKVQPVQPKGNKQQNDKMRCPGHPHIERRVEDFGPIAFPAPPQSGLEALTLPTSRLLMVVGHDYYKKVKTNLSISHGGVCIFMLGVLLSCDSMAYVRPVAHASYSICSGRAT
ncbi:hypothetical protein VPH35_001882 [Triticum aestivum]